MGSGTTAVAAIQNDRQVLGFEISEKYCDIAKRRIKQCLAEKRPAVLQRSLF